jgi:hypothetical protein
MNYEFQSKPSKKTLRLMKEREELEKSIFGQSHKQRPFPLPKSRLQPAPKVAAVESKVQVDPILCEIQQLKQELLLNGGKEHRGWKELTDLESQYLQPPYSSRNPPLEKEQPLQDRQLKHDLEMMEIDFKREKLIAEHELKELQLDLEPERNVSGRKPKLTPVPYNPHHGFHIKWTEIVGMSLSFGQQLHLTFALFDGEKSIRKVQSIVCSSNSIERDVYFLDIAWKPSIRCIVDVRVGYPPKMLPIGWGSIDIFTLKRTVDCGSWRSVLYQHPIDFDVNATRSGKSIEKDQSITYHMYDHSQAEEIEGLEPNFTFKHSLMEEVAPESIPSSALPPIASLIIAPNIDTKESKRRKKKDAQKDELQVPVEEKPEEQGKKFAIGFHLTEIRDYVDGDYCSVRLLVLDSNPDMRTQAFITEKSEPSVEEQCHGWLFGFFFEIPGLIGLPNRKGLFELLKGDRVVATCEFELFKFHFSTPFDINDGMHVLELQKSGLVVGKLHLRIYKPKFGPPALSKFQPKLVTPPIPKKAWVNGVEPDIEESPATDFQVSVDAIRFLPENVTIVRVVGKVFSIKSKSFLKKIEFQKDVSFDQTAHSPLIDLKTDISISDVTDRSSILVLKIFTIELYGKALELVGCGLIHLFVDESTGDMIRQSSQSAVLNQGAFQLPIFSVDLIRYELDKVEHFGMLPRVPCCSILVRVGGLCSNAIPHYEEAMYHTIPPYLPTDYEIALFYFVAVERKNFSVRDRLMAIGEIPKSATHTEESLQIWTQEMLTAQKGQKVSLLDTSFVAKYDPHFGFKLHIDQAFHLEDRSYPIFVVSFTPSYYDIENPNLSTSFKDGIVYSKAAYLDSDLRNPKFEDKIRWYRHRPLDHNLLAIIQLFGVISNDTTCELISHGWTIMPIFHGSRYVRHGTFKLPLFSGSPNNDALQYWAGGFPSLDEAVEEDAVSFTPRNAYLRVHLCDGRRESEFLHSLPENTEFLGSYEKQFKAPSKSSKILTLIPKKRTAEEFTRRIYKSFVEITNLPYVP